MKKRSLLILLVLVVAMLTMLVACGSKDDSQKDSAKEKISAKIILVLEDGTEESHDITVSSGISLREALKEADLIDETNYGAMFVETIAAHSAKMEDGVIWMICDEKKNQIEGLIDDITVKDGQTIYFQYTVAPNFDD